MKFFCIKISLLILCSALVVSCKNPTSEPFQRNSPFDPSSQNFDPSLQLSSDFKVELVELNMFRVSWPQVLGIKKYQLFRKEFEDDGFDMLLEKFNYTDTSFVDVLSESGSYSYLINYISNDDDTLSLYSDTILSNWFEGPELSFDMENFRIDGSPSFAMKTGSNTAMVHYLEAFNETPIITTIDLEKNKWSVLNFQELAANEDWLRSGDFYRVDSNRFIVIKKFFSHQTQEHLGYICEISSESCIKIGNVNFDEDANLRLTTYTTLLDDRIIFILSEGSWSSLDILSFIFDPQNDSLKKIASPNNDLEPTTLTAFDDESIIACRGSLMIDSYPICQFYSLNQNTWTSIRSAPQPFYNMNSILLNNGKVLFLGRNNSIDKDNNVLLYDPILDEWSNLTSTKNSNEHIYIGYIGSFVNSLIESNVGNILTLTHKTSKQNPYQILSFYIEVYDPNANTWVKSYRLPDYVGSIFNFIKLDSTKYLITYNSKGEYSAIPKSAIIYID